MQRRMSCRFDKVVNRMLITAFDVRRIEQISCSYNEITNLKMKRSLKKAPTFHINKHILKTFNDESR